MTEQADQAPVERDHKCQTPECPNDFNVITLRVDDSTTNYLCEGCNLAFNLRVLQALVEDGSIVLPASVTRDEQATPTPV